MPGVTGLASARGHVGTRAYQGSRIDYITEKPDRQHQLGMRRAPILGHLLTLVLISNPLVFGHLRTMEHYLKHITIF